MKRTNEEQGSGRGRDRTSAPTKIPTRIAETDGGGDTEGDGGIKLWGAVEKDQRKGRREGK